MRLLHLSDLHFFATTFRTPLDLRQRLTRAEFEAQGRPGLFREAADRVAAYLAIAERDGIDHLLVTGDLTAAALREEFELARDALAPFRGRLTVLPGNHDRTSHRSAAYFAEVFGDHLRSELPELHAQGPFPLVRLVGDDAAIVALDSGRVPILPGFAYGRIGKRQLDALVQVLRHPKLAGRGVVVALHHAPFRPDGRPDRPAHGLLDAARLLTIVDAAGVAALCHGHIHRRYEILRPGKTPVIGAGSSTQRGIEGYVKLEVDGSGLHRSIFHSVGGPDRVTSREPALAER